MGATLIAAPSAAADGGVLYVSNSATSNCSDNGTGTQAQPYCSLQTAVDAARPGDTVKVLTPGHYGPVHVTTSGTGSAPITVTSGSSRFKPSLWTTDGQSPLFFDHVHDVVFHGFSALGESPTAAAVSVAGSSRVTFDGGQVREDAVGAPGVRVDGESDAFTLSNNQILSSDNAHPVALAAGARGTVLANNLIYYGTVPAIQADDAPGTTVVSNSLIGSGCSIALALNGASTGAVVENNAVTPESTCTAPVGALVVVSGAAAADIVWDYNTVESGSTGAFYSWAGQDYPTSDALRGATGRGVHDTSLTITPATTADERTALLVDSADADAPHEPATDRLGRARAEDPLVANTGTGPGYYDRGASELQDPVQVTAVLSAAKGPAPLDETVTASTGASPWHSTITGYTFDFGDGSAPVASDRPTASHTYTATGSYTVTVSAKASSGTTVTTTGTVQVVADAPLVPALSLAIPDLTSSLSVGANGSGTTDGWSIAHHTFDFGDGSAPQTVGSYGYVAHTYTAPGTYTVTMTVTDDGGRTATTTRQITVGSVLVPVDPARLLDTRNGTGAPEGKVGPGGVVRLKVAGAAGLPVTGVSAVTLNLTGVDATAATYVTAYPAGRPRPTASNLNLAPGQAVPNLVTVPVSADGYVDLYNAVGTVNLIADVEAYYTTSVPAASVAKAGFVQPIGPTRILDTRSGLGASLAGPVGPGGSADLTPPAEIQSCATAAVVNVTATGSTASSWVGVDPLNGLPPTTSVINFSPGQTVANQAVVPLDPRHDAYLDNHVGTVHLVADLQGYVFNSDAPECGTKSPYFPLDPTRILDTREGTGAAKAPLAAGSGLTVRVAGTHGVPAGAKAVLVNLTGVTPTAGTWLAAYPHGATRPTASNLNLAPGSIRPVLALVPIGEDGSIDIYNAFGNVHVVADIEGYYLG